MATLPQEVIAAYQWFSNLFQVDPTWLIWPNLLTIFLVPLLINVWMFRIFLDRIVRIFPSSGVNWALAGIFAFLMLPWNQITVLIAPLIIGFFGFDNVGKKILVTAALYIVLLFGLQILGQFLSTGSLILF